MAFIGDKELTAKMAKAGIDKMSNKDLKSLLTRMNLGEVAPEELALFLHRVSRDSTFPIQLYTQRMWFADKGAMKGPLFRSTMQFKTWSMDNTAFLYKDAMMWSLKYGNPRPLIGFMLGHWLSGELYNEMRDRLVNWLITFTISWILG